MGNRLPLPLVATLFFLALAAGCRPRDYRLRADREVYGIVAERQTDPRWELPERPVEPDPRSRLSDAFDPDRSPTPPDDPAARRFMHRAYKRTGSKVWRRRSDAPWIEDPAWRGDLPVRADGTLVVGTDNAMELALLHSREYQDEVDKVYLAALRLTLERFEFDVHWAAGNRTFFEHFGNSSLPNESNTLSTNTGLGFSRSLAGGGQLIADFANSFVWEFTGENAHVASSGLLITLTQPLLRGAFRHVRMEALTQAERDVLYTVRELARFRQRFYVDVVGGGGGYLSLLAQVQSIRNQQANLERLQLNVEEHQELVRSGTMRLLQLDLVSQEYLQGRLSLLTAENALQTSLDNYKIRLGLPPDLPAAIDDALLRRFELNDPRLDELLASAERLYRQHLALDAAPTPQALAPEVKKLLAMQEALLPVVAAIETELKQCRERLQARTPGPNDAARMPSTVIGTKELDDMAAALAETRAELQKNIAETRELLESPGKPEEAWKTFRDELLGEHFRNRRLGDALVLQTRVRVYLIELEPVDLGEEEAVSLALDNRMDLMNQRARVVDAWRAVAVAADALQADLDLVFQADLNTDPDRDNPFAFDASANRYRVGLEFDSPLVRRRERNAYRARQIAYQAARRAYMAAEDNIRSQIRRDLRDLETNREQFEISRRQLWIATRQLEEAQLNLRTQRADPKAGSSPTRDLLDALRSLLNAKNSLIGNWVAYATSRMNLYRDIGLMEIGAEGEWNNEYDVPGAKDDGSVRPDPGSPRPDAESQGASAPAGAAPGPRADAARAGDWGVLSLVAAGTGERDRGAAAGRRRRSLDP
jgi:outer membrane protein TolC